MKTNRIGVFIDGFNLYYSLRESRAKWLDPVSLMRSTFARSEDSIESVHYFTARVDGVGDSQRPERQNLYLRALRSDPVVQVHFGSFLKKEIERPIERVYMVDNELVTPTFHVIMQRGTHECIDTANTSRSLPVYNRFDHISEPATKPLFARVHTREEKGSDVNLAVQLVHRAWKDEFDQAVVISNDTDLCEAVNLVRIDLGKNVTVCSIERTGQRDFLSKRLRDVSSGVIHIRRSQLHKCQFPDEIVTKEAGVIRKPKGW